MNEIECVKCLYNISNRCVIDDVIIPKIGCENGKEKPKTNADRIRAMSDEELVFYFWGTVDGSGKTVEQWREWLKQECDDS